MYTISATKKNRKGNLVNSGLSVKISLPDEQSHGKQKQKRQKEQVKVEALVASLGLLISGAL